MVKTILNLTMHKATDKQIAHGVFEPSPQNKMKIKELLNFETLPDESDIEQKAKRLAIIAEEELLPRETVFEKNHTPKAMIGGAPFLMASLEWHLRSKLITPLHAFSKRVSEDMIDGDGCVTKVSTFRHQGFVEPHDYYADE